MDFHSGHDRVSSQPLGTSIALSPLAMAAIWTSCELTTNISADLCRGISPRDEVGVVYGCVLQHWILIRF